MQRLSNHDKAIEMYNAIQNKRKQVANLAKLRENDASCYTKAAIERIRRMH